MRISIIVPTYNRANTLATTLDSIISQSNLSAVEVIVIDNGSIDNTKLVCDDLRRNKRLDLKYFFDNTPGLLSGRHLGTMKASGEILCFIDDDVELSITWLDGVRKAFDKPDVQLATGPSLPKYASKPPSWIKYFWFRLPHGGKACGWLSLLDMGNQERYIPPTDVWGLNFCIRRAALLELGGFHPDNIPSHLQHFQGDGETGLGLKAAALNFKALYHPDILLHHLISSERLSVEYFKRRAYYQGICDSFTSLRKQHLSAETKQIPALSERRFKRFLSPYMFRHLYAALCTRVRDFYFHNMSKKIKRVLDEQYALGYEFHQQSYNENPLVKEWVSRDNYWDYQLPV